MMFLEKEINEIEKFIPLFKEHNDAVSNSGIDWHIDHSLKVIIVICQALRKSDPKSYKWKFNMTRALIFPFGFFPRGKAKSPKIVVPDENITLENIKSHYGDALEALKSLNDCHKNNYMNHPYFGVLNLQKAKRFIQTHSRHHIKIMHDIHKVNIK